jgi:hypothetical protein
MKSDFPQSVDDDNLKNHSFWHSKYGERFKKFGSQLLDTLTKASAFHLKTVRWVFPLLFCFLTFTHNSVSFFDVMGGSLLFCVFAFLCVMLPVWIRDFVIECITPPRLLCLLWQPLKHFFKVDFLPLIFLSVPLSPPRLRLA